MVVVVALLGIAWRVQARSMRSRPVWRLSSGPICGPPKPASRDAMAIETIMTATGAGEHRIFGGRLDRGALRLEGRAAVRFVGAPEGDSRGWDAIRDWAGAIAREVR